jgi:general secretion pathway protein D
MNYKGLQKIMVRVLCVVALLTQAVMAQPPIDEALKRKAKLLSPDLAKEIQLEKEERRAESEELTVQGIKMMEQGKYKEAYVALTAAVELSPNNLNAESKLRKINDILYDVYAGYGKSRMEVRDYEAAITHYREALQHKPGGEAALKGLKDARAKLEESVSKNLGKVISDDMDDEQKVDLLMKKARDLEVQSRYEEAKILYKEAISIESEDPRPRRLLKELIEKQGRIIADDRRIERRQIMEDLIKAFFRYTDSTIAAADQDDTTEISSEQQRREEVIRKLQTKLEVVSFDDAKIVDVISYLADVSDVNIVLNLGEARDKRITFKMFDPTILSVIELITEMQSLTYVIDQYAVVISEGEGEMETRFWSVSAQAISTAATEETQDDGGFEAFDLFAEDDFGSPDDEFEDIGTEPEIVRIIKESVPQPQGSTVYLEPTTGTLVVRNTPGNLDLVEATIEELETSKELVQVEIQTRFVQLSDQDLKEFSLSFGMKSPWTLAKYKDEGRTADAATLNPTELTGALRRYTTSDTASRYADRVLPELVERAIKMTGMSSGNNQITDQALGFFTSALTEPQINIVLHALENETNADILSAPSVTTVSGKSRVSIRQIVEVMYPEEYTVYKPALLYSEAEFAGVAKTVVADVRQGYATVESVLTEDVGIELIVSPTIGEDYQTVSMDITTRVSSEIQPHIVQVYVGDSILAIDPINISVPQFKNSEVKTQVVVNDGETIVLGGMITEELRQYDDKVPFWGDLPLVGRLFRSDGSYQGKKNLLIFVTTRIITPTGERYKLTRERRLREEAMKSEEELGRDIEPQAQL